MWTTPEDMEQVLKWRKGLAEGSFLGPRFGAVGALVDGPEPIWPNSDTVGSPEQAQDFVRRVKAAKVDFVKVYTNLHREAYLALAGEARKLGIPFAGHVPIGISASEASQAGQRSIEHLDGVLVGCSTKEEELLKVKRWGPQWQKETIDTYEQARCENLFAQFVRNQTWQVPTLTVFDDSRSTSDSRMKYVPASARAARQKRIALSGNRSAERQEFRKRVWEKRLSVTAGLRRAGVPIMAGTDVAAIRLFPGFSLHDELSLLVQAGLSAREALQAATYNPAKFLGILDRFGSVEKGKIADIVLLDANPLEDIHNTRRVQAVVINGRYLDRAALNDLLAQAAASTN
jgi:hypothetical protein